MSHLVRYSEVPLVLATTKKKQVVHYLIRKEYYIVSIVVTDSKQICISLSGECTPPSAYSYNLCIHPGLGL